MWNLSSCCIGRGCSKGSWSFPSGILQFFPANIINISAVVEAGVVGGAAPSLSFFSHPTHCYLLQSCFRGIFAVSVSERVGLCGFFCFTPVYFCLHLAWGHRSVSRGGSATSPPPACCACSASHVCPRRFWHSDLLAVSLQMGCVLTKPLMAVSLQLVFIARSVHMAGRGGLQLQFSPNFTFRAAPQPAPSPGSRSGGSH